MMDSFQMPGRWEQAHFVYLGKSKSPAVTLCAASGSALSQIFFFFPTGFQFSFLDQIPLSTLRIWSDKRPMKLQDVGLGLFGLKLALGY
jgi:hypothetical protein